MTIRHYSELRQLQADGIGSRAFPAAQAPVAALAPGAEDASASLDQRLLKAAQDHPDPLPLLALRCRVSHPLEAWLRATHSRFSAGYGLDLRAMASYGLDDDGRLSLQRPTGDVVPLVYAELVHLPSGVISPFSAEVIRSYDPAKCGLPHWARLKIQAHNGLKAYFKELGLLLISDWALLRHSSTVRVRDACERFLQGEAALSVALDLHRRFCPAYDQAMATYRARTGKASGWQPEQTFLQELAPGSNPFDTSTLLLGIAKAIRTLQSGRWMQVGPPNGSASEPIDPASLPSAEDDSDAVPAEQLRAWIDAALEQAMADHLPDALAAGRDQTLLRCLWAGWAEGLTNRPLAERCGTSCGTVSKKLRPTELATTIATAAALDLQRHHAFASCSRSVEAAERLVTALRNHLLEPEREGEVAPPAPVASTPPQPAMTPLPPIDALEALPMPPGAIELEAAAAGDPPARLVQAALRQALADRRLTLPLSAATAQADSWQQLHLNRFQVHVATAGIGADQIHVATAPWAVADTAPQLLLAALIDEENGVVWFPGVLTGPELQAAARGIPAQAEGLPLALTAFGGGLDRLFTLVQLLEPAALPRVALSGAVAALQRRMVAVADWISGQLDEALHQTFGAQWQPLTAGAFFGGTTPGLADNALALVAIPLGLEGPELVCGEASERCIERFALQMIATGSDPATPDGLLLRLGAAMAGDLLPDGLTLTASQGSHEQRQQASGDTAITMLFHGGSALIHVRLSYPGSSDLVLPPLQLPG